MYVNKNTQYIKFGKYNIIIKMTIKTYKPYTPSNRTHKSINFYFLTKNTPFKKLTKGIHYNAGRNNQGKITSRFKEVGHKKLYRFIDFSRYIKNIPGIVRSIEYDPNRNVPVCLVEYPNNLFKYILAPKNIKINSPIINSTQKLSIYLNGMSTLLINLKLGTHIHSLEFTPNTKAKLIRSAGTYGTVMAHDALFSIIRLPSKQIRLFNNNCIANVGELMNEDIKHISLGKAGRKRWLGKRPHVRGSAMNPVDHPHGGGEGKSPIGRKHPLSPWGKPALGKKTRNNKKRSTKFIINL